MFAKSKAMAEELFSIAKQRLENLRDKPYSYLTSLPEVSEELFTFKDKAASLFTYRVILPDGRVRIFVTVSRSHLAGMVHTVSGDGFILASDGSLSNVSDQIRWEYL
ncbi:MAG TPA: hypothetical protein VE344_06325 [Methylomirabilota bacterium]|nr:hypothetical protein [Methylomirabilota bacterium]